jgi:hypothetical protein
LWPVQKPTVKRPRPHTATCEPWSSCLRYDDLVAREWRSIAASLVSSCNLRRSASHPLSWGRTPRSVQMPLSSFKAPQRLCSGKTETDICLAPQCCGCFRSTSQSYCRPSAEQAATMCADKSLSRERCWDMSSGQVRTQFCGPSPHADSRDCKP